ncbi:hypothetical protein C2845_PM03G30320 [Panicum miliaceum]|uniref:Uncharacterized protein n=1 Tax=Panicum miliaceum TaxID=4540 RepID=A0A3L6TBC4_PANMI|nr:hypothetical protein C2845_PM03G30320 [Panicum miliaceum]
MTSPSSVPALPLSVATTPPRALPPLPPAPASGPISSLPSPAFVPVLAPAMRTSSAGPSTAAAATTHREAFREGERRKRAQIVPMPTASTRPSSPLSSADPPPPSPSATAAVAANWEATREGKRRKQAQTEGDDIVSAGKRKVSAVKRARAQTAKRFKSPTVPVSPLVPARSTGIRMLLSPRIMSPSTELPSSPQESPIFPFISKRIISGMDLSSRRTARRSRRTSQTLEDLERLRRTTRFLLHKTA